MADKKVKCYTVKNIYLDDGNGGSDKISKGTVINITTKEYDHFYDGNAVTKDIPKGAKKEEG